MLSFDCGLRHHGRQIEALHHRGRVPRTAEVGEGEGRDVDLAQIEHAAERTFDNAILGNLLGAVDLVESWCKAIRAKAEAELLAGRPVPGYKLVEGRRGARRWSDDKEVEATMKSMRMKLEEMYDFSLISPTTADKLHKAGTIGPRQWPKVEALITRAAPKPSVAPASDKRPALVIKPVADEFEDLTQAEPVTEDEGGGLC